MTVRQRLVLAVRHPEDAPSPIFETVAARLGTSYRKVLVEYDRARAALARLKLAARQTPLSDQARADLDRFGRYVR